MSENWWVYELRWTEMVEGFMEGFHLKTASESWGTPEAGEPGEAHQMGYETGVLTRIKQDSDECWRKKNQ